MPSIEGGIPKEVLDAAVKYLRKETELDDARRNWNRALGGDFRYIGKWAEVERNKRSASGDFNEADRTFHYLLRKYNLNKQVVLQEARRSLRR
ncbi:MAG TPA: hypothetical protein VIY48_20665 [Candidatus Paceibacterota bacterium]